MIQEKLNKWWCNTDFTEMEKITGFRQLDFNPEDGYQDFVDVCDNWWEKSTSEFKLDIFYKWS
jgi:hypothetical protein